MLKKRQDDTPAIERRSYERDPAFFGAVLSSADLGRRPCIIRSFCVGGIYAMFPEKQKVDNSTLPVGIIVDIHCAIPAKEGQQILQFQGRIVRSDEQSVGLSFVNPDLVQLQLLQKSVKEAQQKARLKAQNKSQQKIKKEAKGKQVVSKQTTGGPDQTLIKRCDSIYNEYVNMFISHFLKAIDKDLFLLAKEEKNSIRQNQYFEGLDAINDKRNKISTEFCAIIRGDLTKFSPTDATKTNNKAANNEGEMTLSLMEESAFDDWLADTVAIDTVETKYRQALMALEKRLSVIWGGEICKDNNPYGPAPLFRTFQDVIKAQQLDHQINIFCYKTFEKMLLNKLGNMYESINKVLIENKILPVIEYKVKVVKAKIPFRDELEQTVREKQESLKSGGKLASVSVQENVETRVDPVKTKTSKIQSDVTKADSLLKETQIIKTMPQVQAEQTRVNKVVPTQIAEVEPIQVNKVAQTQSTKADPIQANKLVQTQTSMAEPIQRVEATRTEMKTPLPPTQQAVSATGQEVSTLAGENIYSLVGEVQCLRQKLHAKEIGYSGSDLVGEYIATGDASENVCTQQELLLAISQIQPKPNDPVRLNETPDLFKKRIFHTLQQQGDGSTIKKVAAREARILDVASYVFHSLLSDLHVAEDVRRWIKRLEVPVLKIALIDESLFLDKSHVVRQVINKIASLELITQMNDAAQSSLIKQALDWLVNLINAEANQAKDAFSRASSQLDLLIEIQNKTYQANVDIVVKDGIQEERLLERDQQTYELNSNKKWSVEQNRWFKKVNRLLEGEWLVFDVKSGAPQRLRLAWHAPKSQRYIFVDVRGVKDRVLLVSELIEFLITGDIIILSNGNEPAMDRAQYMMLQDMHREIIRQTTHDNLTGLINHIEFEKHLQKALDHVKCSDNKHALCVIELDKFQIINDACGFAGGDQLLLEISKKLSEGIGRRGVLARMAGAEFAMMIDDCPLEDALDTAESMVQSLSNYQFTWKNSTYSTSVSMGMVSVTKAWETAGSLIQAARSSCELAKNVGGGRLQLYHSGHTKLSQRNNMIRWISDIDEALAKNKLLLRAQKIKPIGKNEVGLKDHYEMLLVVKDNSGREFSIQEFIKAAEWYNKVTQIDRWVISNAMKWMSVHPDVLKEVDSFSLNLSGLSLNDESLIEYVEEQMLITGVPPEKVCFEITETAGISNLSDAAEFIERVKQTGCKFSLDDFGTGMSSYAYLKNLPIDYLKIDGGFVKEIIRNDSDYAVVKSICEIGHYMGKKIIAECVENDETLDMVRKIGVDFAQGYGIAKPVFLKDLF